MSQFPSFQLSNFSQRQFEIPIQDEEMDTVSQSSSNQALHQQIMQNQLIPSAPISPIEAAAPRRGFLGNVFGSRSRTNTAIGPDMKNSGKSRQHFLCGPSHNRTVEESITKAPKRRGPKPDSKPAQNRRQELNRQAQR